MLRAQQEGITSEELIARIKKEHETDFADFHIAFDNYHSTHSEENRIFSEEIYKACRDNGHIAVRNIKQLFDPVKEIFLADRYIKGECPSVRPPTSTAITAKPVVLLILQQSLSIRFLPSLAPHLLKKNLNITFSNCPTFKTS